MQHIRLVGLLIAVSALSVSFAVEQDPLSQNHTGPRSPPGSCVALQDNLFLQRMFAAVGIYSESGVIVFDGISAALTEVLLAAAARQDVSGWQLCVDLLTAPPPAPTVHTLAMLSNAPDPTDVTSEHNSPSVTPQEHRGVPESSERVVDVNSLSDSEADPAACSVSTGSCNLRSAVAYCESMLPSMTGPCIVNLPEYQTLPMSPSLGSIVIMPDAVGEMSIEGNGCIIVGNMDAGTSTRLLSVDTSSAFSFSMRNASVVHFGDPVQEGGALFLRGLGSVSVTDVHFESTMGSHGGALYIDRCTDVALHRCSFTGTSSWSGGGAIFVDQGNMRTTLSDCTFEDASSGSDGGAIYVFRDNVRMAISDCSFTDTSGSDGGAIYVNQDNFVIVISNCVFTDTSSEYHGGAIYADQDNLFLTISDCIFTASSSGSHGGVIHVFKNNFGMTISHSSFTDTSSGFDGGAIHVDQGNDDMAISDCSFTDTLSGFDGGAIYVLQGHVFMVISDCSFKDTSSGSDGGAIYVYQDNMLLTVSECSFTDTSSGSNGGAIHVDQGNDDIVISDCSFTDTLSGSDGGAISLDQGNDYMAISDCSFTDTSSGSGGGAISLDQGNDFMTMLDSIFTNTSSGSDGGAISVDQDNDLMTVLYCSFTNTSSRSNGGAISLHQSNDEMAMSDCIFTDTSSRSDGGAIYVYQGNLALVIRDSRYSFAYAQNNGGAILVQDGNNDVRIIGCMFEHSIAGVGGGAIMVVSSNLMMSILECTFVNNIAGDSGGAIEMAFSNVRCIVAECLFIGNEAPSGGGLYVGPYHGDFVLQGCSIENSVGINGAGVYVAALNKGVLFFESSLHNNTASEEGGGLYSLADSVTLDTCVVYWNRVDDVDGVAGGVYLTQAISVDILYTRFVHNSAGQGGGLGVTDCGDVMISHSHFVSNTASALHGGAILGHESSFNISESMFADNAAAGSGGALWSADATSAVLSGCTFNNSVSSSGNGAAVWLSGSSTAKISGNTFDGNRAPYGGGAVYWVASTMAEPTGVLVSNIFYETNYALYGSMVATEVTQLSLDPSNVYNVTDYDSPIPKAVVHAKDYYSQIVKIESSATVTAAVSLPTVCFDRSGYVTGGIVEFVSSGVATFDTLEAYCAPGYSMPITLTATVGGVLLQKSFELWFRECVTGEYYGESICNECERGTLSVTDPASASSLSELQSAVCEECPSGASVCFGNTMLLEEGYWRINSEALSPLRCPYKDSCKGGSGTGDALCSDGYEGPVCGVCANGYSFRQFTRQCEPCSDSAGMDAVMIATLIAITLCAVLTLLVYRSASAQAQLVDLASTTVTEDAKTMRHKISVRLKMYVMLWQIVSLLPYTLDLTMPNVYEAIASVLNVLNLGVSISSLVNCSSGVSFDAIDNLILATVYPIIVTALVWLLRTVHLWYCRSRGEAALSSISARYFGLFLWFIYLILPSVSLTIFQTFSCRNVDPDDVEPGSDVYMSVDLNVSCRSGKYRLGLAWAIVSILVYPVGVPAYYFYLAYSARSDIKDRGEMSCQGEAAFTRDMRLRPIRLLYELYTPDKWYWEVVETGHRLMLTGVLVVIERGSGVQIVVGAVVALVFLKVCDVCQPFVHIEVQMLREFCQWQIFALFFLALLLKADFESVDGTALAALLVLAVLANIIVDAARLLFAAYLTAHSEFAVGKECRREVELFNTVAGNPLSKEDNGR